MGGQSNKVRRHIENAMIILSISYMGVVGWNHFSPEVSRPFLDFFNTPIYEVTDMLAKTPEYRRDNLLRHFNDTQLARENIEESYFNSPIDYEGKNEEFAYFSIDSDEIEDGLAAKISTTPDSVIIWNGNDPNGLEGYESRYGESLLKVPLEDIRLDRYLSSQIGEHQFQANPQELIDSCMYDSMHKGSERVEVNGGDVVNFNTSIAKSGDEQLEELVNDITKSSDAPEEKAQDLLDFVSENISMKTEDEGSTQTLKNSYQVLLSQKGICGHVTSLYASLLNQVPELSDDYILVYRFPEEGKAHIALGIKGDFPREGGLFFEYNDSTYALADPTIKGHKIGHSFSYDIFPPIEYVDEITHIQEAESYARIKPVDLER